MEWVDGLADRDQRAACTRDTRFQIASVSKQFTAAAVLVLADRGVVSLDDRIERWFGDCRDDWRAITVHHLLTHTAGLGHWRDFPDLDLHRPLRPEQQMEIFQRVPLLSPPGSRWRYSSPGYVLLGWIVQQASGQPYAEFLADHIFTPLGLRSTSAGDQPGGTRVARGYHDGQPVRSFDLSTVSLGAGDVWSTVNDLVRWDDALAGGELLTPARRTAMLTAHAVVGGGSPAIAAWTADGYGYGLWVGAVKGHRAYFHPGDNPGYLAFNAWLPGDDIRLVVLVNEETTDLGPALTEMLHAALSG